VTHLDTSFLVDLLRESARGVQGPAHALLERLGDETVAVSVHVACELYGGVASARDPATERSRVDALLAALEVVHTDDHLPYRYGEALAELRKRGQAIGTMDLLIAAAALGQGASLVTRNAREFDRVPGLVVQGY
jgi:tRNA(fMet)-specific endonuclease VapC